ncbi:hypothetical protein [Kinneretia aquatilis]|uniref:hypothetical protein n=1 Tax=Kinneretia aquatilis TaxID=2070761 RepID=UPI0014952A0E|nr:hypothetical protein [Paucibacter aquatile]WIV97265.1 hypothetical protein K9V56_019955 [Paucibacter aquatile]
MGSTGTVEQRRSLASAVSWSAVAAGAAAAASLSLILLILGVGLGLSSVSPWALDGISAASLGISTIVWLTLTQLLASAMGGYLAGRLRTRWTEVHADEVYFRDTAHGFLAWAVASLATATLLTSVIGSILGAGAQAGATAMGAAAGSVTAAASPNAAGLMGSGPEAPLNYFIDTLFRRTDDEIPAGSPEAADRNAAKDATEVGRIFMNVSRADPLPPADLSYVAQIVARRTGLTPQDAQVRVAAVYASAQTRWKNAELAAREAANQARKASAYAALWLFVSLLIGAFVASFAATFGGRRRDA